MFSGGNKTRPVASNGLYSYFEKKEIFVTNEGGEILKASAKVNLKTVIKNY